MTDIWTFFIMLSLWTISGNLGRFLNFLENRYPENFPEDEEVDEENDGRNINF